jgi:hypothetical protein
MNTLPPHSCSSLPAQTAQSQQTLLTEAQDSMWDPWTLQCPCGMPFRRPGGDFALVQEAVEIWNDIDCLTLCYEAPVVSSRAVDLVRRERRVHIIGRPNDPTSTHIVSPETGRVAAHQSEFIGRPVDAPRTVGGALAALVTPSVTNTRRGGAGHAQRFVDDNGVSMPA